MSNFALTPQSNRKQQVNLIRKGKPPAYLLAFSCLLLVIIYALYFFDILDFKQSREYQDWEAATALVTTSNSTGTAFLVSYEKLLTARHVVEDLPIGAVVNLIFDRVEPKINAIATLEWKDETSYGDNDINYFTTDLAVLKLENPSVVENLYPLFIGDSDFAEPLATEVVAVGYPAGDFSITKGTINNDEFEGTQLFKVDVASNPGNSGGPLISLDDDTVIGMLVGQRGGVVQGENIANKSNNISALLQQHGITLE